MNKNNYVVAAIAAALGSAGTFVALSQFGCGGGSTAAGGSELAVVNGDHISMDELYKHLETKQKVKVLTNNGPAEANVAESLTFQGLQDLIVNQIIIQIAKDEGVYPTEQEVLKELDYQKKLNPNFLPQLTQSGMTVDRIKQQLTLELAKEKILTKGVTVTPQEAEDFIKANPKQFTEPATADLLWVFVKSDAAKAKVDQAILAGQTFSMVATQNSEFPGARSSQGRFPQRRVDQMPVELQKLVNATVEGRPTGTWLKLSDGFAKFYVEKKTAEKPIVWTPEKKEGVRRSIAKQRGALAIDLSRRVQEKLAKSKIDVKAKQMSEMWKKAFDRFKEEQKVDVPGTTAEGGANP